ncbi:MAG: sulfate adenylyltransferase [Pseudomonadota bacterium]|nr:sulfate adenylyltransferase [Pseudomonadota bacterium]MEC8996499.1 sulfate adenylyltransferase [Pseudomonadota bacterium]MED5274689.1 sulfate adenylyltransferase [Pseudomonadota bacterium]MED5430298.1 sulfate adenylyltransferase [Pseudomonadota bacterium]|tara:strand:+ start:14262 stop:15455 length:1194 start_codon:yes stop_codon:yes gene_type:complete
MQNLIEPHGSKELLPLYVNNDGERQDLLKESKDLKKVVLNSSAASCAVMLGAGYFTPLSGFMNKNDSISIAKSMKMMDGLFWPIPIMNLNNSIDGIEVGERIALLDPNIDGNPPLAIQSVQSIEELGENEINEIAKNVFGTNDSNHPGVKNFLSSGRFLIAGEIKVLNYSYFPEEFPNTFATASEIRQKLQSSGWLKTVAFQTRNPMHRAHEELCKMALDRINADGVLIHMTLGKLKEGDIPGDVRDKAIRKMVELYFAPNTAIISGFGFDMLYAGPREALLHATFRQNCGCSHLIIGRDHAGVGDYYGAFDAQEIFENPIVKESLKIEIFAADHTAYSKKLNKVVMMRDVKDHNKDDFVLLSGTKVREMLSNGEELPQEFARKEVAEILMNYYQSK